jgi:uncharacterized membrane protein
MLSAKGRLTFAAGLILIVVTAIALRALPIASWPLWLDESWSRWLAEMDWQGLRDSTARYDTHPPFYYSLLKLWLEVAPHTPEGLRLLSVLAGLAMLPLAWVCASRIEALRSAPALRLASAALVAVSPPLVVAAHQARPYALFALAFALALWAALRLLTAEEGRARRLWALWIGFGFALEAVLWLHNLGMLFAAALSGALFVALWREGRLRRHFAMLACVHLLCGLAFLPHFAAMIEQRRAWQSGWLRFAPGEVPEGLATGLAMPGVGALLLFVAAGFGAAAMLRDKGDRGAGLILAAAAFLPAVLALAISTISTPVFLPRTLVPSALPLILLAAAGLAQLRSAALRGAALGAMLLLAGIASAGEAQRPPEEKWDLIAAWVEPRMARGDEVWLLPNEIVLPLGFAAPETISRLKPRGIPADFPAPQHRGPRYSGTPAVPGLTDADVRRLIGEARGRGARGVWVVSRFPNLFDPGGALAASLGAGDAGSGMAFAPIGIRHYRLDGKRTGS